MSHYKNPFIHHISNNKRFDSFFKIWIIIFFKQFYFNSMHLYLCLFLFNYVLNQHFGIFTEFRSTTIICRESPCIFGLNQISSIFEVSDCTIFRLVYMRKCFQLKRFFKVGIMWQSCSTYNSLIIDLNFTCFCNSAKKISIEMWLKNIPWSHKLFKLLKLFGNPPLCLLGEDTMMVFRWSVDLALFLLVNSETEFLPILHN